MHALVYHIEDPDNPGLDHGYIGVVNAKKGVYSRFREHCNSKYVVGYKIRHLGLQFDQHVKIIYEGDINECYDHENKLRPTQNIGWNLAAGGGGPYETAINLKEHRSKIQSERMKNSELKKRQSESFKKRYYENLESQNLRSLRAKEHMSNLDKKKKCLDAMHKLVQCPHCEFASNAGNVKQHIKRKHNDV